MINLRSDREIDLMRQAGQLVYEAHQLIAPMVVPGVTTIELDRVVEAYFDKHDAIPLFKGVPGKVPFPSVCCISVNEEVVHGIPSNRVLEEGDVVSIDTGCKLNGWCGDAAITHPVGQVAPDVAHLLDVTRGTLELSIELLGEKDVWSQVAAEMEMYVRDHGMYVVENFVGHGIGREMHEDPQVPNYVSRQLKQNGDFRIEEGLVIAVEPMVNLGTKRVHAMPDHWTMVAADGRASAHFEHTIAITEDGPWPLTAAAGRPTAASS